MEKLSVIIPCFNDEENIVNLKRELILEFKKYTYKYEIIFIDDGSKDKTFSEIEKIISEDKVENIDYVALQLSKNYGQHQAIWSGLEKATGDKVAIISSDLQEMPSQIFEMIKFLDTDTDQVYGIRKNYNPPFIKKYGSIIFWNLINYLSDLNFDRRQVTFRVMTRRFVNAALTYGDRNLFVHGVFLSIGFKSKKFEFNLEDRKYSKSGWTIRKSVELAINAISTFSIQPLRAGILLGFICTALAIIFSIYVAIRKLVFDFNIPGYASILILVSSMFAMQFFLIGVIGEYIGKVYLQTLNRPRFIIKNEKRTS